MIRKIEENKERKRRNKEEKRERKEKKSTAIALSLSFFTIWVSLTFDCGGGGVYTTP